MLASSSNRRKFHWKGLPESGKKEYSVSLPAWTWVSAMDLLIFLLVPHWTQEWEIWGGRQGRGGERRWTAWALSQSLGLITMWNASGQMRHRKTVWAICPMPDQQSKLIGRGGGGTVRGEVSWKTRVEEAQVELAGSQRGNCQVRRVPGELWKGSSIWFQQQRGPDGLSLIIRSSHHQIAATKVSDKEETLLYSSPADWGKMEPGTRGQRSVPELHMLLPVSAVRWESKIPESQKLWGPRGK